MKEFRGHTPIENFDMLRPNDEFLMIDKFNNSANVVIYKSGDKTGLNRQIAYFNYKYDPKEREDFALWGYELNTTHLLYML